MTCAKLWPDLIITIHIRAMLIFASFRLCAHQSFCKTGTRHHDSIQELAPNLHPTRPDTQVKMLQTFPWDQGQFVLQGSLINHYRFIFKIAIACDQKNSTKTVSSVYKTIADLNLCSVDPINVGMYVCLDLITIVSTDVLTPTGTGASTRSSADTRLTCTLTHWPLDTWMKFYISDFQARFTDWWLRCLLWNCPGMNVTGPYWWWVHIG